MYNWNWKDLLTNRERRGFPEVVVPLARASPETKHDESTGSNSSLDRASVQEKGASALTTGSTLTLEALRAEVEADVVSSGHDTAYDRMFLLDV